MSDKVVLYRCPTPTNWLCRCGTVARAAKRHGYEVDTVRVGMLKRDATRDAVERLTGQRTVPVLVVGKDAICDSRRVLEHLEWRAAAK